MNELKLVELLTSDDEETRKLGQAIYAKNPIKHLLETYMDSILYSKPGKAYTSFELIMWDAQNGIIDE